MTMELEKVQAATDRLSFQLNSDQDSPQLNSDQDSSQLITDQDSSRLTSNPSFSPINSDMEASQFNSKLDFSKFQSYQSPQIRSSQLPSQFCSDQSFLKSNLDEKSETKNVYCDQINVEKPEDDKKKPGRCVNVYLEQDS